MNAIYRITYHGKAFGDNLFSAYVTKVLELHGFDARLDNPRIACLVDCPTFSHDDEDLGEHDVRTFGCVRQNRTGVQTRQLFTVYSDLLHEFSKQCGIGHEIDPLLDHVPVRFTEDRSLPSYDVVMVTETGWWTPYRNWPHFGRLKKMLSATGISFIDVSEERIRGNRVLNLVRTCRLFLGLETGVSHYVSRFANGKALILQSGYSPFSYWAGMYDYRCLCVGTACSPCWRRSGCDGHECMTRLRAERVYEAISEALGK